MRLFVGLEVAGPVRAELDRLRSRLRRADDELRWSEPENWHVTLQFLGNADARQQECLGSALAAVRARAVSIRLRGTGAFLRAGVFFAEIEQDAGLVALQAAVVQATAKCGFAAEDRPYQPHITLARRRGRKDASGALRRLERAACGEHGSVAEQAREFVLYESQLNPGGPVYVPLRRFALDG